MAHVTEPAIHNVRAIRARSYLTDPVALDIDVSGPDPSYYGDGRVTVSLYFPSTPTARRLVAALAAAINNVSADVGEVCDVEEGVS